MKKANNFEKVEIFESDKTLHLSGRAIRVTKGEMAKCYELQNNLPGNGTSNSSQ